MIITSTARCWLLASWTALVVANLSASAVLADGNCKKLPIPDNYVPVAEFNSPECDGGTNPFALNAWELSKIQDGVVSCQPLDYKIGHAPGIAYVICRGVITDQCPARMDGGPNAFEIRTPLTCGSDLSYSGLGIDLGCADDSGNPPYMRFNGITYSDGLVAYTKVDPIACRAGEPTGQFDLKTHRPYKQTATQVGFVRMPDSFAGIVPFPFCARDVRGLFSLWQTYNDFYLSMGIELDFVIVRHFFSPFCIAMEDNTANAIVVARKPRGETLVCADSFSSEANTKRHLLHDDRCGVGTDKNALYITSPP